MTRPPYITCQRLSKHNEYKEITAFGLLENTNALFMLCDFSPISLPLLCDFNYVREEVVP